MTSFSEVKITLKVILNFLQIAIMQNEEVIRFYVFPVLPFQRFLLSKKLSHFFCFQNKKQTIFVTAKIASIFVINCTRVKKELKLLLKFFNS